MTQVIPLGSMAEVTKTHESEEGNPVREGTRFIVRDFVSEEESYDGVAFYNGDGNGGWGNITAVAAYVKQVMTPEQVEFRRIPSENKLANALISSITGSYGPFFIHTGGPARGNEVEFEGTTSEGLDFVFTIRISDLEELNL